MRPHEWKEIYLQILDDLGFDQASDESSARLLKAVMLNSDIISDDDISIKKEVTVFGNGPNLENDIAKEQPTGTLIASGSAVGRLVKLGITPELIVTDLDGEIIPQIECSNSGAITFIHAHGDNTELIQRYAPLFKGPVVLTTETEPDNIIMNYGGFTDGDRAVCIARHFGAKDILLLGFDFDLPMKKEDSDEKMKFKKLQWAKKIIFDHNDPGVVIRMPD